MNEFEDDTTEQGVTMYLMINDPYLNEVHTFSKQFEEEISTWPELLYTYLQFLSGVYGYDLTDKVGILDQGYVPSGWQGRTFKDK